MFQISYLLFFERIAFLQLFLFIFMVTNLSARPCSPLMFVNFQENKVTLRGIQTWDLSDCILYLNLNYKCLRQIGIHCRIISKHFLRKNSHERFSALKKVLEQTVSTKANIFYLLRCSCLRFFCAEKCLCESSFLVE